MQEYSSCDWTDDEWFFPMYSSDNLILESVTWSLGGIFDWTFMLPAKVMNLLCIDYYVNTSCQKQNRSNLIS
jgi:hypothetical protein